ncbi:thioredoxin [Nitzschia inconspicua]|uniref:Thioredoxin n=1 Tax=Nitzschia inconspicua TaxID=303405 RepID=A0A9K3L1V7_9STRA|nr:thioredoxin [Nitzschia inconspicua]
MKQTLAVLLLAQLASTASAFMMSRQSSIAISHQAATTISSALFMTDEVKAAPMVTGEELELMLTEWDLPLVVDAYATWCGPCLLMSPEYEAAAEELKGKVRFVKLDTDKEEEMAARLNIMGLPTLLFLDKFEPKEDGPDDEKEAKAVLKGRIEGALRKQNIVELCNFYFFDGPEPKI